MRLPRTTLTMKRFRNPKQTKKRRYHFWLWLVHVTSPGQKISQTNKWNKKLQIHPFFQHRWWWAPQDLGMKVIYLMNDFEAQGFLLVGDVDVNCSLFPLDLYYAPLKILTHGIQKWRFVGRWCSFLILIFAWEDFSILPNFFHFFVQNITVHPSTPKPTPNGQTPKVPQISKAAQQPKRLQGYGILTLEPQKDCDILQEAPLLPGAPIALLGAGA